MRIRAASEADAAACARVYAPYVTGTAISFEERAPTPAEMAARIAAAHAWLVAEDGDGAVTGYAYAGAHRDRAAYRWAADVAVYLDACHHGRGLGRALYEALFPLLRERGLRTLCAGVTLPNPASEALHLALGFREVGIYHRIGYKLDAWHDVRWYELDLFAGADRPPQELTREGGPPGTGAGPV